MLCITQVQLRRLNFPYNVILFSEFRSPYYIFLSVSVTLKKLRLVEVLHDLGVNVKNPCDTFGETPTIHAQRLDDSQIIQMIRQLSERDLNAAIFFSKNYLRSKQRKKYLYTLKKIRFLQNLYSKGFFKAQIVIKNNDEDDDGDLSEVEDDLTHTTVGGLSVDAESHHNEEVVESEVDKDENDNDDESTIIDEDIS